MRVYQNCCVGCKIIFGATAPRKKYCSEICNFIHNTELRPLDSDACCKWTGLLDAYGYGLAFHGRHFHAHVFSYLLHKGPIEKGLVVRHKCRTPACINPNHLELGTRADNNHDRFRDKTTGKGITMPHIVGSRNWIAKIDEDIALKIFQAQGSTIDIAKQFNVSTGIVYRIKEGINWRHVTSL